MEFCCPALLTAADRTDNFCCGEPSLDDWLHNKALYNQQMGYARSYIAKYAGTEQIAGYYALAVGQIERDAIARNALGFRAPKAVPVILLARLAVDNAARSCGLGGFLLRSALERSVQAAEIAAARAVITHPLNAAAEGFYRHFGFKPIKGQEEVFSLPLKDIYKAAQYKG